jgi:hypothetical protein
VVTGNPQSGFIERYFVSPVANGEVKRKLIERRKSAGRSSLPQPGLRASPALRESRRF